jgi:hypothetical protein
MSTKANTKTATPSDLDARVLERIVKEGYGPGAWHGPDLKAALDDVSAALAFWRPSSERHNIAEIALHHAYCARSVRGQLLGSQPEPFVMEGDDWFSLSGDTLSWPTIREVVDSEQKRLAGIVTDIAEGRRGRPLADPQCLDLVLGITCHAIYHAGQIQLIKKIASMSGTA